MPSASDELRDEFGLGNRLPEGGYDDGIANAEYVITQAGGTIGKDWFIRFKVDWSLLPAKVQRAVTFLQDEWDYGFSESDIIN